MGPRPLQRQATRSRGPLEEMGNRSSCVGTLGRILGRGGMYVFKDDCGWNVGYRMSTLK